jgi:hypothetical protein
MGFVVLHIKKPKGNDTRTTAHIERTVYPANADPARTHFNQNLIEYPDTVENRTQAIQYRIQADGKLDDWCEDNIKWLQGTFGKKDVVSAVLHLDEKTPHIHATVVPIVQGERRKAEQEKNNGKKKYRKKAKDTVRLCTDDVMTRDNLERFQDTYAEIMEKYGLQRGIRGSEARRIDMPKHYRDSFVKSKDLKEDIGYLEEQKQEEKEKIWDLYDRKDEAREKFLDMDKYVQRKEKEIADMETRLNQLKQEHEPYKAQEDMNLLSSLFPILTENLRIAKLCEGIGLAIGIIKKLFAGEVVSFSGNLRSSEHDRDFSVQDAKLEIVKEQSAPNKFFLYLNGQNITDWFKHKYQEVKQAANSYKRSVIKPEVDKNKGIKR